MQRPVMTGGFNSTFHETQLPCSLNNYALSPAAKRALVDGSLAPE